MQRGPIPSQMVCQDARRAFPYMVAGEIPLTEWALLERHVGGCEECRTELNRLREQAAARARDRQRQTRRSVLMATTALVVIIGAGLYVHQYGLPQIPRPESFSTLWPSAPPSPPASPAPPASSAAKPRPASAVPTPPTGLPSATGRVPRPGPVAAPLTPAQVAPRQGPASEAPPSARQPPVAKTTPPPAPASSPLPVSPTPAVQPAPAPATAAAPAPSAPTATASDERMPTQASTGRVINAAPSAEAMPTQGQPPASRRP